MDGEFTIVVKDNATLVFSSIAYVTQEIAVNGQTTLSVVLKEDTKGLDEVVVVGYGTVKKSDLTGSVSSVKSDQLSSFPTSGALQALQGRAAGVEILSNNGDPGGSVTIKVRGGTSINASSAPLYVVDGFPGAMMPEPEDIATLEVLKDASATAIYGSRGANGVIMITTKKGVKGKIKIEYNASLSQQQETHRIEMLNAQQFLDLQQPYYPTYVSDGQNTDWQDVIFKKGATQTHQLSMSGGGEKINFYLSGAMYDQQGIIIGSGFKKYSLTNNIDIQATDKLKFSVKLFGQRTSTDGVLTQEDSGGAASAGVVGSALRYMPDMGIYQADGLTYSVAKLGDPIDNPYTIIHEKTRNAVSDRF
jgi:TonB-linked SusC/RagA family outer membrane protein